MPLEPEQLDWTKGDGLLPVVVQDAVTLRVLMLGYMNREALDATLASGKVTFYSRSKQRLWTKGESSGHTQQVRAPEANKGMVHQPGDIGPESIEGDYYYQSPVFWGTERQGPDLTHVASRIDSAEWQKLHLKDPRSLNPGTLMPSFAYLSDRELDDLVAYILTLK